MKWQHKQFISAWDTWVKNKWSMKLLVGMKKDCSHVEREKISGLLSEDLSANPFSAVY